mgnify:CR=1 FL=1
MGRGKLMFDNVINEEAIEALTPDQIDVLLEMFEKAGYWLLGQLSINFCDTCDEFGVVSVVDGKLMIQPCDCVEGE